jgi:hypothetical protein
LPFKSAYVNGHQAVITEGEETLIFSVLPAQPEGQGAIIAIDFQALLAGHTPKPLWVLPTEQITGFSASNDGRWVAAATSDFPSPATSLAIHDGRTGHQQWRLEQLFSEK